MDSGKSVSPIQAAAILAVALIFLLTVGYFVFWRQKDPDGISDAKLTPEQKAEQKAGAGRIMSGYMNERNGGGGKP